MSENENKNIGHTDDECDCGCDCDNGKKSKKDRPLTVHDLFLGIFYAIIIFIGVILCFNKGLNANITHLLAVTVSVIGVFVLKMAKFRRELRFHITDITFAGIMSVLAVIATIAALVG